MTGYTRKDTTNNIADGNIINADDLDNEFDGVQAAFHASTGHTHDGTAAEGAAITKVGPVQDVLISTAAIYPKTTNTVDLGTSSLKYKDAFIAGNETVGGTLAVTGVTTLTAQPILSSLTASSAVATDASKGLVSVTNTGTGNNVLATSPTLVTPVLGAATGTSLVLTAATSTDALRITQTGAGNALVVEDSANPDASPFVIDPAGVVLAGFTTAPAGGYKAYVSGTGFATSSWRVGDTTDGSTSAALINLSNTTKSITLAADPGNLGASTLLNLAVDGTTWATLNSSGNFGVGTTNPQKLLHANGTSGELLRLSITQDTGVQQEFGMGFATSPTGVYPATQITALEFDASDSRASMLFYTRGTNSDVAPTEQMRIDSAGNVGIGTTSPSVRLSVDTTASSFAATFRGAESTNFVAIGTTTLGASINAYTAGFAATANLVLQPNGGNLGLGVTPSAWASTAKTIDINTVGALSSNTAKYVELWNNGYFNGTNSIYKTTAAVTLYQQYSGMHVWSNAPSGTAGNAITFTQAMTLDASGNLGIGTTSPTNKLDVAGSAVIRGSVAMNQRFFVGGLTNTGASSNWFYIGTIRLDDSETAMLRIDGVTGYGTGAGIAGATFIYLRGDNSNSMSGYFYGTTQSQPMLGSVAFKATATASTFDLWVVPGGYAAVNVYCDSSGVYTPAGQDTGSTTQPSGSTSLGSFFTVSTAGYERMRMNDSGNFMVGTTITDGAFTVGNALANGNTASFKANNATGPNYGLSIASAASAANTVALIRGYHTTSTNCFNVAGSGNVTNTNNSYGAISDIKLKENIVDVTPKLDALNQVRIVNYNLIGEEQKQIGVVAQELEQIFPGMIDESPDCDMEGNDLGTTTKSVKYSVFVPMLIKAIQEQQALITALTARITALEAK